MKFGKDIKVTQLFFFFFFLFFFFFFFTFADYALWPDLIEN
jgi:hypothetical protein